MSMHASECGYAQRPWSSEKGATSILAGVRGTCELTHDGTRDQTQVC